MEQLSSADSLFVFSERANLPMHMATIPIYDPSSAPGGAVRLKDVMELFERAVHQVPLFRQRLVEVPLDLDQPYWIDDPDFDIEYHVRHVALPKPGDWRQFYIQVARINARPLDRARPLWEVYVIEGLSDLEGVPEGSFALMMKLHHAALRGEALKSLFLAIHSGQADQPVATPELQRPLRREVRSGNLPLLLSASQNNLKRAIRLPRVFGDVMQAHRRIQEGQLSGDILQQHSIPSTTFNTTVSPHRSITSYSMPFKKARSLKTAIDGASINDLALTVIGGAMRLYLQKHKDLPRESLVASAPVNLSEGPEGDHATQKISMANIALHTEIEDALERFYAIHESSVSAQHYLAARGADLLENYDQSLHPYVSRSLNSLQDNLRRLPWLEHIYPETPNTLISNMPGPMEPVYFCGARVVTGIGLSPCMPNIGLVHTVSTVADQLIVTANACRSVMPDPEFYQQCLAHAWAATEAALAPEAKRHQTRRRRHRNIAKA